MSTVNDNYFLKDAGYSNYENTTELPRHRWYYYKEGFSPLLVEKAIDGVGLKKDDIVIDPFNGSGTTTLVSSIKGYRAIGIEVNPFTSFLAEAKLKSAPISDITQWSSKILKAVDKTSVSNLLGFSTFSKTPNLDKWLFNDTVLNAFEGGWQVCDTIPGYHLRKLMRLSLISSAMQNCNATRDGKCLRYRDSWIDNKFDKYSFTEALIKNLEIIATDIEAQPLSCRSTIFHGDARQILKSNDIDKFKLCITSPPYLNTFDYTDIYRPELFLGKFIENNQQLYNLRLNTVRSHLQAKWEFPTLSDFGLLYEQSINHLNSNKENLMHKNIPLMTQAYFEDILNILKLLKTKAQKNAELWLVVSNSAYADKELPVDLIIAELGSKAGWFLREVGVLRYIRRRKTKHSPNIHQLRESVVIFSESK